MGTTGNRNRVTEKKDRRRQRDTGWIQERRKTLPWRDQNKEKGMQRCAQTHRESDSGRQEETKAERNGGWEDQRCRQTRLQKMSAEEREKTNR